MGKLVTRKEFWPEYRSDGLIARHRCRYRMVLKSVLENTVQRYTGFSWIKNTCDCQFFVHDTKSFIANFRS
jgi:hypothetical protein